MLLSFTCSSPTGLSPQLSFVSVSCILVDFGFFRFYPFAYVNVWTSYLFIAYFGRLRKCETGLVYSSGWPGTQAAHELVALLSLLLVLGFQM